MGRVVETALANSHNRSIGGGGRGVSSRARGRGYKLTYAQHLRTMSYYKPVPKKENFLTADRSLFMFDLDNPVRKFAKRIIEWPYPFY